MIGETLGHYRILDKLGEGGMGVVYRAEDTRLGRTVALKVLPHDRLADPRRLARFLQEARLASSLNHPNIATILDVGEANGLHYIAMEIVEGGSLRRRIAERPLKLPELLELSLQIADALAEAHGRGILHRDIKSENIIITPQGRAKVLDFGLAKLLDEAGGATQSFAGAKTDTGVVMGTVTYMSPEQALGQPLDARSDLFSLGVVFYEMAVGRLPFDSGTSTSTIDRIIHAQPVPPSSLNPDTPFALEQMIVKLLEKNPDDRYQSARELVVDLRRLKRALDTGALEKARLFPSAKRKFSWRQGLLFALALAGVGLAGFWMGKEWRRAPAAASMRFSAVTNFAGIEAQPTLSPDGRSVAFVSDRGGQYDVWVGLLKGGSLVRITNDANLKARPRWSPDGSKIAYARLDEDGFWNIWVVEALGGTPHKILTGAGDPAWSPDGRSLAYADGATQTIWIADANGGNARPLTQAESGVRHVQPAFSRDGQQIAFARFMHGPYSELAVVEIASGKVRSLTEDGALTLSPVWSPDDQFIYFASSRGGTTNIWKIPARGGTAEQITAGQGDDAELDLSADGQRMVFSSYRININLAEVSLDAAQDRAPMKWLTTDSARGELGAAYSRDGSHIAYFTNRKGAEKEGIWVMNSDGANPVQLVDDENVNIFPRWAPDGQALFFESRPSGKGAVWAKIVRELKRVALTGGAPEDLHIKLLDEQFGDVAPDGRLVFHATDGSIQIRDPQDNQTEVIKSTDGYLVRWSPDGRAIAFLRRMKKPGDPDGGLWVYNFAGQPRQLFRGWLTWFAWAGPGEIFAVQGKPDLNAVLWRMRLDGSPPVRIPAPLRLYLINSSSLPDLRFDAHPDRRRIVIEALELHEADIGMIENIR